MDDVYKAIAHETRRLILDELLLEDRQTLFELCGRLAIRHGVTATRQGISQHLGVLEGAGLLVVEAQGRYRFHSINTEPLRVIADRWPLK